MVDRGFRNVTVADVSRAALERLRERLGPRAAAVALLCADVRSLDLPRPVDLWHDRAVLHFMVERADRAAYVASLRRAVKPGGHVVLAAFAPSGPPTCSGLPVARFDAAALAAVPGGGFTLVRSFQRDHVTPAGRVQPFTWCLSRRG